MRDLPPHQSSRPTRLTFWAGSLRPCRRIGAGIFESESDIIGCWNVQEFCQHVETGSCRSANGVVVYYRQITHVSARYSGPVGRRQRFAFSLIELLTVISIIALLMGLMLPVLAHAKESGRRAVCLNHVRQFIITIHLYADDNEQHVPSGLSESGKDEHTPVLSRGTRDALVKFAGNHRILMCAWLGEPFTDPNGWYYDGYGYVIGYNYLGGHEDTPWPVLGMANAEWESPQSTTDRPSLPIVTELNAWSTGEGRTFAPHGPRGPILQYGQPGIGGIPSEQIGAAGGNVGLLDGSASWKKMPDMKIYRGSHFHGIGGCFTAW